MDVRPLITTLRNNYSLDNITQYLYDNVPFSTENLSNLEAKVEECKIKVHEHAKKIVHMEGSDEEKDQPFPEQGILFHFVVTGKKGLTVSHFETHSYFAKKRKDTVLCMI